ncbi:hypothetical protein ACWT_6101 [Actinoplanes sp. SE50]|uniref:hypothetical protein n=1 Tax=unclassified Actinoplanes TaxID=2626549 RepID=UPI00023ECBA6|nr:MULTISPECIES: hypothetical protein [unclassified Actinoplanes]AEV87118.1 hypothetical protein ACPL_6233 [Actinoplanes sp. SE50/110]ATO85516.1 hypothetical protein ACWT_6101 [Actinoplanes sp. SE50]SLM02928.1 uncharacterized protein ACSP50_6213 [Actinoplanes sp. SE50/110]
MIIDREHILAEMKVRALVPDDCLAVFAVGSIARGWANPGSDFDFIAITARPWSVQGARSVPVPLEPNAVQALELQVGERRWEIAYWLDGQIDQMLAKASWQQFDAGISSLKVLTDPEELLLGRFPTAVPLLGADWLERRRAQLAESAYKAFMTTRSLAEADGNVEDVFGMLAAGDAHSAVLAARKAFGHIVDALLESNNDFASRSPKWRARRMRDAGLPVLPFERYWAVETMADFDEQDPAAWAARVAHLCKDLSVEIEI